MNSETLRLLEFRQVIGIIQGFARHELGRRFLATITPLPNPSAIKTELALLEQFLHFRKENEPLSLSHLGDLEPALTSLGVQGTSLQLDDFFRILAYVRVAASIRASFASRNWPLLSTRFELPDFREVDREIDRVLDPREGVRESASPELKKIRHRIIEVRETIQERLHKYLTGHSARYLIENPFVTQRNNRFVLPVRAEHQSKVPGVAHGSSSSGATLYLEPLPLVDLNNTYLHCQEKELEIIQRILARLTDFVRPRLRELQQLVNSIAELDALQAKSAFAEHFRCVLPDVSESPTLLLKEARHPLLENMLGAGRIVPIALELNEEQSLLVISGPNTGGKTVALKTTGLLVLLGLSGLPVPALEARIPCFREVLADIGDNQSISESLSTYSAHILRIKEMVESLHPPTLILLDELGAGTDPVFGASLGISILDHFRTSGAYVVATTHLQALKQYASSTPQALNASVELDPETMAPTFHLRLGLAAGSSALEIASRLGLPSQLVDRARSFLEQADLRAEAYLTQLRQELQDLRKAREQTTQQQEDLRRRRAELELEQLQRLEAHKQAAAKALETWSAEFRTASERFLKQFRDRFESARLRQQLKAKEHLLKEEFRRKITESVPGQEQTLEGSGPLTSLAQGDWVYNAFFRKKGKVVELGEENAVLLVDGKRVQCRLGDLKPIADQDSGLRVPPNIILNVVDESASELDLIGCRVDEGLDRLDKFLDRAFVSQLTEVRIIHGFGTGRLKKAVSEFLKSHPQVARFSVEGGTTAVLLKSD